MGKKLPETNPFVQIGNGFTISAVWKTEKLVASGTLAQDSIGTKSTAQFRAFRHEVDDRISLYTAGFLTFFPSLSTSAKDMMMYIASRLQFGSEIIELDEDRYCATMNVSRSTFFNSKKELVNHFIIPRTSRKNTYWINPSYMFKGNRMEKYPDAVRMRNEHPFEKLDDSMLSEPDAPYGLE